MKEDEFRVFEEAMRSKLDSADRDLTEAIAMRKETVALAKQVQRELTERETLRDAAAALEAKMRGLEHEAVALRVDRNEARGAAEKAGSDRDALRVVEAELSKLMHEFADLSQRKNDVEERRQRLMTQADPFSSSQKLPNTLSGINLKLRDKTEEKEKVAEEVMSIKDDQIKMMRRAGELDTQARAWTEDQDKLEVQAKKMLHLGRLKIKGHQKFCGQCKCLHLLCCDFCCLLRAVLCPRVCSRQPMKCGSNEQIQREGVILSVRRSLALTRAAGHCARRSYRCRAA